MYKTFGLKVKQRWYIFFKITEFAVTQQNNSEIGCSTYLNWFFSSIEFYPQTTFTMFSECSWMFHEFKKEYINLNIGVILQLSYHNFWPVYIVYTASDKSSKVASGKVWKCFTRYRLRREGPYHSTTSPWKEITEKNADARARRTICQKSEVDIVVQIEEKTTFSTCWTCRTIGKFC